MATGLSFSTARTMQLAITSTREMAMTFGLWFSKNFFHHWYNVTTPHHSPLLSLVALVVMILVEVNGDWLLE
ncbi:MAG: hypothetical protein HGA95_04665 [Caldiserica bacterium]|nr:hypothetical protein [Caldisericota bacterium]